MSDDLRVWIGNQAVYADRLVGEWVDATDADELSAAFDRVTRGGQDEHFVGDIEGPAWFRQMVGEWGSFDAIVHAVSVAEELESEYLDSDYFTAWWDGAHTSYSPATKWDAQELVEHARDDYWGEGDSERDAAMAYAEEMIEDMSDWDYSHLDPRSCIDWDAYARNLQNDFRFCRVGGTVYIVGSH